MMYQRNHNQRDNYNDDNYDSSESDSDSDADAEMEENNEQPENDIPIENNNLLLAENINDNANQIQNNDLEDEAVRSPRPRSSILNHIDYLNKSDDENLQEDSRPVGSFDDNSRGNFGLALLGEGSGCNLNLDIVPPVNDESSRESMDIDNDYDNDGEIELGDINISGDRNKIINKNMDLDEAGPSSRMNNYYGSDEYNNFMRINKLGDSEDVVKLDCDITNCKCSKCLTIKETSDDHHRCVNCNSECCDNVDVCTKRVLGLNSINNAVGSSKDSTYSCQKNCSSGDLDRSVEHKRHMDNCDNKLSIPPTESSTNSSDIKENDDNCDCTDEREDREEADTVPIKECDCFIDKLDHENGHSSKMCIDIAKTPCEKCTLKTHISVPIITDESKNKLEEEKSLPTSNPSRIRPREANADGENARPVKKVKLNNGSAAGRNKVPRTIFHKALDAVGMSWDNQHLKNILASNNYSISSNNSIQTASSSKQVQPTGLRSNFNSLGQPLWHEPLSMCAARVDSLRSHGHTDAALRLSVSVVRTMKQIQKDAQILWHRYQQFLAAQYPPAEEPAKHSHCCCNCKDTKSNSRSSTMSTVPLYNMNPHKEDYKMYRYDYNSTSRYNNIPHDGCKRCMETRERVNYHNHFNSNFQGNRYNLGSNMHPPPFFRTNFGPLGNHMYDQRYGSSNINSGNRYNYLPNLNANPSTCHADNCNIVHRSSSGMVGDSYFFSPRPHCSKDLDKYIHDNYGHRCLQEMKGREATSSAKPSSAYDSDQQKVNCDCRHGKTQRPADDKNANGAESNPQPAGNASDSVETHPSTSASASASSSSSLKPCSQHTKNQCCIKNYCCKIMSTEKPKCCTLGKSYRCDCSTTNKPSCNQSSLNSNIYFGRNTYGQYDSSSSRHYQKLDEQSSCKCVAEATSTKSSSSNKINYQNIVNYGASTSKAALAALNANTPEFVRNKKPSCVSNCLDCCVGCEIEFPLDAVACIFDCLTEACIIPDSINGPDMGRLSFDSVSGAAEDGSLISPRYHHVRVPLSNDRTETYLTLAFEVCLTFSFSVFFLFSKLNFVLS